MHPTVLTDLDFADDITLLSNTVSQVRKLLLRVESKCKRVGLHLNTKNIKLLTFNIPELIVLKTSDGQTLQVEKYIKFLGSWINSSEKEIKVIKALAWSALHSMDVIWKSKINLPLKRRLFVETVDSVLIYGSESWTLTVQ